MTIVPKSAELNCVFFIAKMSCADTPYWVS